MSAPEGQFKVTTLLDWDVVCTELIGAFEGGSNYWLYNGADFPTINWGHVLKNLHKVSEYAEQSFGSVYSDVMTEALTKGLHFKVTVRDDTGQGHNITPQTIRTGVNYMANAHPSHYRDMITGHGDAITGDVLLQCILFKDVVYG